uniref:Reverse transcriptase domain-containing protein n=1 Tax=Tanacetum cinerariifolium TaxID=118510 RepID=A0A699HFM0_TANCI|nr:reverse transcriptase domain-containing protein [Tanacetum cinerariifolium]
MRTRSQSRRRRQQQVPSAVVEPIDLEKPNNNQEPPVATTADNRTMAQLLEAPTKGYEEAIVVPDIIVNNFEIKHAYAFPIFPWGAARIWLDKEPPRSILTWDDLVSKFINQFFPPSKKTNLHNEITRFQQRFDESFYEACDRFNDLLRACQHHGFSELHQLDTFYNALNTTDQDSLNSAAGGSFLDKMPRECQKIIESKSRVLQSRSKAIVANVSTSSSTLAVSSDVAELKDMVRALLLNKKNQAPALATVKAPSMPTYAMTTFKLTFLKPPRLISIKEIPMPDLRWLQIKFDLPVFLPFKTIKTIKELIKTGTTKEIILTRIEETITTKIEAPALQAPGVSKTDFESYVKANDAVMRNVQTQGQTRQNQLTNLMDMLSKFVNANTASSSGPTIPSSSSSTPPKVVNHETEVTKDTMLPTNNGGTEVIHPPVVQNSEPVVAPVSAPMPNQKTSTPFPSRRNDERRREKANDQIEKFYEIFRDLSFEIRFTDALTLMSKFALTLKSLMGNKEKLSGMARTPLNENCSAVILNKLPKKHGDPGRFLIPCEFLGINTCNALADLGASINLIPHSVWKDLSLPELTLTCMTGIC